MKISAYEDQIRILKSKVFGYDIAKKYEYYKQHESTNNNQNAHLQDDNLAFSMWEKENYGEKILDIDGLVSPINRNIRKEKYLKTDINKYEQKDRKRYFSHTLKNDFSQGVQELVEHVNRLFFYQTHLNMKPRETGVYIKAHKRMKQKLKRLKKMEQTNNKFMEQ